MSFSWMRSNVFDVFLVFTFADPNHGLQVHMGIKETRSDPLRDAEQKSGGSHSRVIDEDLRALIVQRASVGQSSSGSVARHLGLPVSTCTYMVDSLLPQYMVSQQMTYSAG
jgi:hypothetical protein